MRGPKFSLTLLIARNVDSSLFKCLGINIGVTLDSFPHSQMHSKAFWHYNGNLWQIWSLLPSPSPCPDLSYQGTWLKYK